MKELFYPSGGSLPSANITTNDIEIYAARSAATIVEALTAAYLHPESKFHGNNALIDRIRLATGFLNRRKAAEGPCGGRCTYP